MSYDLMVFEPTSAPAARKEFLAWYEGQAEWAEDHEYDDPKVSSPALKAFFLDLIQQYPPMNGPYAAEDLDEEEDEVRLTDYTIGTALIYIAFAWSQEQAAYAEVSRLAAKHQVGFFDASSEQAAVWLPDGKGGLAVAHTD